MTENEDSEETLGQRYRRMFPEIWAIMLDTGLSFTEAKLKHEKEIAETLNVAEPKEGNKIIHLLLDSMENVARNQIEKAKEVTVYLEALKLISDSGLFEIFVEIIEQIREGQPRIYLTIFSTPEGLVHMWGKPTDEETEFQRHYNEFLKRRKENVKFR